MIILKWLLVAAMVAPIIADCFNGNARKRIGVFSQITAGMLVVNLLVILLVVAAAVALQATFPFLRWSWLSLLGTQGINPTVAPMAVPYIGIPFTAILIYNMPNMAHAEEELFRSGLSTWGEALPWAIIFGLSHCLIGVPLSAGIALTIAGLWFTSRYFAGGIELSTAHHTAYNLIVVTVIAIILLVEQNI